MTNKDKFVEKVKIEQEEHEKNRIKYIKNLGETINEALLNPKFIEKVTPLLKEYGSVQFSDGGPHLFFGKVLTTFPNLLGDTSFSPTPFQSRNFFISNINHQNHLYKEFLL